MTRQITASGVAKQSGEIMRAISHGEEFVVTRHGVPIADLHPMRRRQFVPKAVLLAAFADVPSIDYRGLREDIDGIVDQSIGPRI